MYKFGDVVLALLQFTDTPEIKVRPAAVLFQEYGNVVVAGITSNPHMKGIPLIKKEGVMKDSVIKLNYIFTIPELSIRKHLFSLTELKKEEIRKELIEKLR